MFKLVQARPALVLLALPSARSVPAKQRHYSIPADTLIPKKSKVWNSADEAIKDVKSGSVLFCGGKFTTTLLAQFRSS